MTYKHYLMIVVGCILLSPQIIFGATRLGLFHTAEEVVVWQDRSFNGPYKTSGDVSTNSPGDWDRIAANAANFLGDPDQDRWAGQTSASCVQSWQTFPGADPEDDRKLGHNLTCAGFYYAVKGGSNYLTAITNELLAQAATAGTDFSDGSRWCSNLSDANPSFDITAWLLRLIIGYSFIRPDISEANRNTIDTWFENAGIYWESIVGKIEYLWVNRDGDNYTMTSQGTSECSNVWGSTHDGGYTVYTNQTHFNNRRSSQNTLIGLAGIIAGNTTLKNQAKRYVKECIRFATYPDGTFSEYERSTTSNNCTGWAYTGSTLGHLILLADAFARDGDSELYDYSTSLGWGSGSCNNVAGGPKTFEGNLQNFAEYVDHTLDRTKGGVYQIDSHCPEASWYGNRDTYLAQANLYFNNSFIKGIYMRTDSGAPAYPASPNTGGSEAWGGTQGVLPGVLFMFGDMEGEVDPYGLNFPSLESATINAAGTQITLAFDESVNFGDGGSGGGTISASGGAATLSYNSGGGTTSLVYDISRTICSVETVTYSYTQPGDGIEDDSGNDLANIDPQSVTNNSTQTPAMTISATDNIATEVDTTTGTYRISSSITDPGVSVAFTMTGTAASPGDYSINASSPVAVTGNYKDVTLTPVDDSGYEGNETAIMTLNSGTGYTVGSPSSATITILDDDPPPTPPEIQSATIDATGRSVTVEFDKIVNTTSYATGDFNLDCINDTNMSMAYSSGTGSTSLAFTITPIVFEGESCTIDFDDLDDGGNSIEDGEGTDLETCSDCATVTNSSTQNPGGIGVSMIGCTIQ